VIRTPFLFLLALAAPLATGPAAAQGPAPEPAPFSAVIPLAPLADGLPRAQGLPIWIEAVQRFELEEPVDVLSDTEPKRRTVFRIRIRPLPGLSDQVLLRLYFDDLPGLQPAVSTWNEIGENRFASGPLGSGLGLPQSESLLVPLAGATYLDVEAPGSATHLRTLFVASAKTTSLVRALDFDRVGPVIDPFDAAPAPFAPDSDRSLFGRVRSTLDASTLLLSPRSAAAAVYEFELAEVPAVAVLAFEIANADVARPPEVTANDSAPRPASLALPDLADPGVRVIPTSSGPHARYEGWMPAQIALPAAVLRAGTNRIAIDPDARAHAVALRNVTLQLKYPDPSHR
jgi:hypothetical protein